jgi:hypothetical protein
LAASQRAKGIVSNGVFNSSVIKSNFLVENNVLVNTPYGMVFSYVNGAIIRNNLLANANGSGILSGISTSFNDEPQPVNFNVEVYNNTIYYGTIGFLATNRAIIKNNILSGLSSGHIQMAQHGGCVNVNSDYNALVSTASSENWNEGAHSLYLPGSAPLFVDLPGLNFRLAPGGAPINAGISISPAFSDLDGFLRPTSSAWDMGAYKFVP